MSLCATVVVWLQAVIEMPRMTARGLGVTLSGLAHLNLRNPPPAMLATVAACIDAQLDSFVPNTFGNVVWSLCVLTDRGQLAEQCFPTLRRVRPCP